MEELVQKKGKIYKEAIYYVPEKSERKTKKVEVDAVDRRILNILIKNSRTSFSDIAKELNIGVSTAFKRINDLFEKRIIKRATVILDNEKVGMHVTAFIMIKCRKSDKKTKENIVNLLKRIKGVVEVHEIFEPWDFVVKARNHSMENLKNSIISRLLNTEEIKEINVSIVLNTVKEEFYDEI